MAKEKEVKAAKYTIENLVKDVGIIAASVRVQLRNNNVKKRADGTYGWDSQADYLKVKALWDKKPKKKAEAKAPAKKAAKKTAAKKAAPAKRAKKSSEGEAAAAAA